MAPSRARLTPSLALAPLAPDYLTVNAAFVPSKKTTPVLVTVSATSWKPFTCKDTLVYLVQCAVTYRALNTAGRHCTPRRARLDGLARDEHVLRADGDRHGALQSEATSGQLDRPGFVARGLLHGPRPARCGRNLRKIARALLTRTCYLVPKGCLCRCILPTGQLRLECSRSRYPPDSLDARCLVDEALGEHAARSLPAVPAQQHLARGAHGQRHVQDGIHGRRLHDRPSTQVLTAERMQVVRWIHCTAARHLYAGVRLLAGCITRLWVACAQTSRRSSCMQTSMNPGTVTKRSPTTMSCAIPPAALLIWKRSGIVRAGRGRQGTSRRKL